MSDTSADKFRAPSETSHLWWLNVVLVAILLAVISIEKWKPFGWFPAAFGTVLGLAAVFLPLMLNAEFAPGRDWHLFAFAGVAAALTILVAGQRHRELDT